MIFEIFPPFINYILPGIIFAIALFVWMLTLIPLVPRARMTCRMYRLLPRIRSEDASHLNLPAPPELESFVASLRTLDFRHLGERRAPWPGTDDSLLVWMMVDEAGSTYAEASVTGDGQMLALVASAFEDGAFLESGYLKPERLIPLQTEDYYYEVVGGGAASLLAHHRRHFARMAAVHGPGRRIDSMADYFAIEAHYLRKHMPTKLKPELRRWCMIPAITSTFAMLVLAAGVLMAQGGVLEAEPLLLLLTVLLIPVVLVNRSVLVAPGGAW